MDNTLNKLGSVDQQVVDHLPKDTWALDMQ